MLTLTVPMQKEREREKKMLNVLIVNTSVHICLASMKTCSLIYRYIIAYVPSFMFFIFCDLCIHSPYLCPLHLSLSPPPAPSTSNVLPECVTQGYVCPFTKTFPSVFYCFLGRQNGWRKMFGYEVLKRGEAGVKGKSRRRRGTEAGRKGRGGIWKRVWKRKERKGKGGVDGVGGKTEREEIVWEGEVIHERGRERKGR